MKNTYHRGETPSFSYILDQGLASCSLWDKISLLPVWYGLLAKNGFHIFKSLKKNQKKSNIFVACKNDTKFQFQSP